MPERLGADGVNLLNSCGRDGLADRLPLPHARHPALRTRTRCGCRGCPSRATATRSPPRRATSRGDAVKRLATAAPGAGAAAGRGRARPGRGDRADVPARPQEGRARPAGRRPRRDEQAHRRLAARRADDAQGVGGRGPRGRLAVHAPLRQGRPRVAGARVPRVRDPGRGRRRRSRAGCCATAPTGSRAPSARRSSPGRAARTIHLGFEPGADPLARRSCASRGRASGAAPAARARPAAGTSRPDAPDARDFRLRRDSASG